MLYERSAIKQISQTHTHACGVVKKPKEREREKELDRYVIDKGKHQSGLYIHGTFM